MLEDGTVLEVPWRLIPHGERYIVQVWDVEDLAWQDLRDYESEETIIVDSAEFAPQRVLEYMLAKSEDIKLPKPQATPTP